MIITYNILRSFGLSGTHEFVLLHQSLELLFQFGHRLDGTEFTAVGLPDQSEVVLIKDIWAALTDEEHAAILARINEDTQQWLSDSPVELPDQTGYAMRLTFRYLKLIRNQQVSS